MISWKFNKFFVLAQLLASILVATAAQGAGNQDADHGSPMQFKSLLFSPDGKLVAAECFDFVFWDISTGKKLDLPKFNGSKPQFTPDGKLAWFHDNLKSRVYDFAAGTAAKANDGSGQQEVEGFSPDGKKQLLSLSTINKRGVSTKSYELDTLSDPFNGQKSGRGLRLEGAGDLDGFSFSPDSSKLVLRNSTRKGNPKTTLYDTATGQKTGMQLGELASEQDSWMQWSEDSSRFAVSTINWIYIFDGHTGKPTGVVTAAKGEHFYENSVSLSPDGNVVAAVVNNDSTHITSKPQVGRLWSAIDGRQLATLDRCVGFNPTFWFSPDSKIITAVGASQIKDFTKPFQIDTAFRWNVPGGTSAEAFALPPSIANPSANHYCFSPDINTLAAGCNDGSVKLWKVGKDPAIGQALGPLFYAEAKTKMKTIPAGSKIVFSGTRVYLVDADGNKKPLPDGTYQNGKKTLVVRGGQKIVVSN